MARHTNLGDKMDTLQKIDNYLNEQKDVLKDVLKFLKSQRTWLEDDGSDENVVSFITRDNGDVGNEKPGKQDMKEAQRLAKLVKKKFGNNVDIDVDYVDEWVHIEVTEK